MDKRKSLLNVTVSVFFKIATMIVVIFTRRVLIQQCGNEVNGLNSLYASIIGMLAVAELGVGGAITFCMYKPIVEENYAQVSALYQLFRKIYAGIGLIVLACGLAITPFMRYFAKDYAQLDVNFQLTFLLMLASVVTSYFFGAKTALINAFKNNYITNAISSGGLLLEYVLEIVVLLVTHSYAWYLSCKVISSLTQWAITSRIAGRKYGAIMAHKETVEPETRKTLTRSIKAMFMHKIGGALVNSADSVIISAFVGVIALGEYSNYTSISTVMAGILGLVFSSLTSILGHVYVGNTKEVTKQYSDAFHLINFLIGLVFYMGYYAIVDDLIAILFSPDLVVEKSISFVITMNGFVQFMRSSTLTFRDATGAFYHDRWKPLLEGATNVILSIWFVHWMGVTGVIAATILTNLLICHVVEPYVLYKDALEMSPKTYFVKNYAMIALFSVLLLVLDRAMVHYDSQWLELLVNGCISVALSAVGCVAAAWIDRSSTRFIIRKFAGALKGML